MPDPSVDLDLVFCHAAKTFKVDKILLKAIAQVESSFIIRAYRFEPAFWEKYMKDKPEWKDRDPREVSASYGLMQVMYPVAINLGFSGPGEGLYDPMTNVLTAAKLVRQLTDGIKLVPWAKVFPIEVILARYNGGFSGNPGPDGTLRNAPYVAKVIRAYWEQLRKGGCDG